MNTARPMSRSCEDVVFLAYGYLVLEWLFFATKPSFLSTQPWSEQLASLWVGSTPLVAVAVVVHGLLLAVAWAWGRSGRGSRLRDSLSAWVPAGIVASGALILFDNFTYTMARVGLVHANWSRVIYALGVGFVFVWWVRRSLARTPKRMRSSRLRPALAGALVLTSVLSLGWVAAGDAGGEDPLEELVEAPPARLPNIILFASDGIQASRMSAYGYERQTTPHLDRRLDRALVFDNAFTNSGWTTGSVTSMVTGQYPASTKVLYPPYRLQGSDALQTLPRLLRELGYRTQQESVRYYADGPDLNWLDSFDEANGREIRDGFTHAPTLQLASDFAQVVSGRLTERLLHLAWVQPIDNPFEEVIGLAHDKVYGTSDRERMGRALEFIDEGEGPFFLHLHLMDTHCCNFQPQKRVFSAGEFASEEAQQEAAFDDTIREADEHFETLMRALEERGLLDDTLVVVSSDHTMGWDFREQVPLIFFFPKGEHRGRRSTPAQLLDVTPTILDHLALPTPSWLEGSSLLGEEAPANRPIFAISRLARQHFRTMVQDRLAEVSAVGPPTYGLQEFGLVSCHRWYTLQLDTGSVESGVVESHREPCDDEDVPTPAQAGELMARHLRERGFSF